MIGKHFTRVSTFGVLSRWVLMMVALPFGEKHLGGTKTGSSPEACGKQGVELLEATSRAHRGMVRNQVCWWWFQEMEKLAHLHTGCCLKGREGAPGPWFKVTNFAVYMSDVRSKEKRMNQVSFSAFVQKQDVFEECLWGMQKWGGIHSHTHKCTLCEFWHLSLNFPFI